MGDIAERDEEMFGWPDFDDFPEVNEMPRERSEPKPIPVPVERRPVDLKSLTGNPEGIISALADLEDGQMDEDGDWETAMHFLVPAFLENRPDDLVRILWDRANKRASEARVSNPAREFQLLLQDFDLCLSRRL